QRANGAGTIGLDAMDGGARRGSGHEKRWSEVRGTQVACVELMRTTWCGVLARELRNVQNKYIENDAQNWGRGHPRHCIDKLESFEERARHYLIVGALRDLLPDSASILDVGCGCGTTYRMLRDRGAYRGIDLSAEAIDACVKAFPESAANFGIGD